MIIPVDWLMLFFKMIYKIFNSNRFQSLGKLNSDSGMSKQLSSKFWKDMSLQNFLLIISGCLKLWEPDRKEKDTFISE